MFFPVVASLFAKGVSAGALIAPLLPLPPMAGVVGAWLFQLLRSRP